MNLNKLVISQLKEGRVDLAISNLADASYVRTAIKLAVKNGVTARAAYKYISSHMRSS